jgi:hypothetical protein
MSTKMSIFLIFLTFISASCEQKEKVILDCDKSFVSFIDTNNHWTEEGIIYDSITYTQDQNGQWVYGDILSYKYCNDIYLSIDTSIDSKPYIIVRLEETKTLIQNDFDFTVEDTIFLNKIYGFVREDHCEKKVYFLEPKTHIEYQLYDFNMQIGDTLKSYLYRNINEPITLYAKDSMIIGNQCYPVWILVEHFGNWSRVASAIIEGVGGTDGLIDFGEKNKYIDGRFFNEIEIYYPMNYCQ